MRDFFSKAAVLLLLLCTLTFCGCSLLTGASSTPSPPMLSEPSHLSLVTPEPTPDATVTPAPTPIPLLGIVTLKDSNSNLRVRSGPGADFPIIGALSNDLVVGILNQGDAWHKIAFADFSEAYTSADYIEIKPDLPPPSKEVYYVLPPSSEGTERRTLPQGTTYDVGDKVDLDADGDTDGRAIDTDDDDVADMVAVTVYDHLVDIRKYIPGIVIDLVFATDQNFTGKKLYSANAPLIQHDMVNALKKAQQRFNVDGYSIKIVDAYRPHSVQRILYNAINNPIYVADPEKSSNHNRGTAIDMTLVDAEGNELEMPSPLHTFDESAHRDSATMSDTARANMEYMTRIMAECGFTYYKYEWWHFNYKDAKNYMVTDYNLSDLILLREE